MASSLLALLDDITTILDDVALMAKMTARKSAAMADDVGVMTKIAAQKTAGVLGDDLALNAEQVSGVNANREIPVVWAVAKGSLVNKAILVPAALAISALAPWAITPLLMVGGAYLCFEGVEKLAHKFLHKPGEHEAEQAVLAQAAMDYSVDLVQMEKDKIKGAVRTDFVLSAEIIVISLGTLTAATFGQQVAVLTGIALIMTIGVYGLVAGIVKLDDLGVWLNRQKSAVQRAIGSGILAFAPWLMKALSVVGTAAMFLVGGGILVHGIAPLHHWVQELVASLQAQGGVWTWLSWLPEQLINAGVGIVAGALVLAVVTLVQSVRGRSAHA